MTFSRTGPTARREGATISRTKNPKPAVKLERGFTLLELLIVIVILAFVLGASVPLFSRTFSSLQLEVFSHNAAKLLSYAGKRAVAQRNITRVHFDMEQRGYWLLDATRENTFERVNNKFGRTYWAPDGIVMRPSAQDVTFYPDGRADPFELLILNRQQVGYRVTTHVWTGQIRLLPIERE